MSDTAAAQPRAPKAGKKGAKKPDVTREISTSDVSSTPPILAEAMQAEDVQDGEVQVNGTSESSTESPYVRELQK